MRGSKKSANVHFWPRYQRGSAIDLVVGKMVIPVSSDYKYLGVVLDQFLTYKSALADRTEKAFRAFGVFVLRSIVETNYQYLFTKSSLNLW